MIQEGTSSQKSDGPDPGNRSRLSLKPRAVSFLARHRVVLLLAPAVLVVCMLLGSWALRRVGVGAPRYALVDLKALGNFIFDDTTGHSQDIPRRWRDLDGQRVELRGFMLSPGPAAGGLVKYSLEYQAPTPSGESRTPLVQQRVEATMPASAKQISSYDFVRAVGVLHVGVLRDQSGNVSSVFQMDVESVNTMDDEAPTAMGNRAPTIETAIAFLISYLFVVALVMVRDWPWRDIRGRRAVAGLCPSCGYDLRASRGQCPECGRKISDPLGPGE
jgi:hypothetical protein